MEKDGLSEEVHQPNFKIAWLGLLAALFLVGAGVFIFVSMRDDAAPDPSEIAEDRSPAGESLEDDVLRSELNRPIGETGRTGDVEIISAVPGTQEPGVDDQGHPVLLLDNLAGSLQISLPFLQIRNKMPLAHSCFGANVSPSLLWSNAPAATRSYVVFMEKRDSDSAVHDAFVNWALFNIPADETTLGPDLPKTVDLENGARHARGDNDATGYFGPCEPKGQFNYALRVFALDKILDVPGGVSKHELIRNMNGHIIDAAEAQFIHYRRL